MSLTLQSSKDAFNWSKMSETAAPTTSWTRQIGLCLAVALAVRLLWSLGVAGGTPMYGDALDYFNEGVTLADGSHEARAFYWPPGMGYFLASLFGAFGPSLLVTRIALSMLSAAQIIFMTELGRELGQSRRAGLVAGWFWALYPPAWMYVQQSGSQHLSAFCLAGAAIYAIRLSRDFQLRSLLNLGLLLGCGVLTRPSMLSVVLATCGLAVINSWPGRALRFQRVAYALGWSSGVLALVMTCLAPTIFRNHRLGGEWGLSTNNERNFFIGNNSHTPWYKTSHLAQRPLASLPVETQAYLTGVYSSENPRNAMKQAALAHVQSRPDLFVLRTFNRVCAFWGFDYLGALTVKNTLSLPKPGFFALLFLEAESYCVVVVLALAGLCRWKSLSWQALSWIVVIIAAYAAPYALAFSSGTYHYPVMGLVIALAAAGVTRGESSAWPWANVPRPAILMASVLVFALLQIEYLYFAVRHFDG